VQGVLLDGSPVKFTLEQAVGAARVVIAAPVALAHRFEVRLAAEKPKVEGPLQALVGAKLSFQVRQAAVAAVHDPQEVTSNIQVVPAKDGESTVSFIVNRPGKLTVFVELQCGEVKWLHPLDLDARQPWTIVERYRPPLSLTSFSS